MQWIVEDGHLPVLDEDRVHPEVLAIDEGRYPEPPRVGAEERGLFGWSYEGFQPPLAHLLSGAALLTKLTMAAFLPALAVVCVAFLREGRWRSVLAAAALPGATV